MTEEKDNRPRIVAFSGPKTSGKDTMATPLFRQNVGWSHGKYVPLFSRQPFAYGVKSICSLTFGWDMEKQDDFTFKETVLEEWPRIMPRQAMMDIANFMREKYGPDVWVHALNSRITQMEKVDPHGAYVITDLRFPNEVDWLLKQNALIIYVQRDEAERALREAQEQGDEAALNPSEMHYDYIKERAHVILDNNRDIPKAQSDAMQAIRSHFEHWTYWGMQAHAKEIIR